MTITFDKSLKKAFSKKLGTLRGKNCYYCGSPLNQENWAGVQKQDKLVYFCSALPCLLEYSDSRTLN